MNDNLSYRRFARVHEGEVPKKMTLNENIKRISLEGWEEIHKVIIQTAKEFGLEEGKRVRMVGLRVVTIMIMQWAKRLRESCLPREFLQR